MLCMVMLCFVIMYGDVCMYVVYVMYVSKSVSM